MVWIKICGITNIEDAYKIARSGCDALGLIFANSSLRKVSYERAVQIVGFLRTKFKSNDSTEFITKENEIIKTRKVPSVVGVFVNDDINEIAEKTLKLGLDFVQFSGDEDNEYLDKFRKKLNSNLKSGCLKNDFKNTGKNLQNKAKSVRLIKLIRVKDRTKYLNDEIIEKITKIGSLADYFLLDKYSEKAYGGTGETFNWKSIKNLGFYFPVILAGGLCPENVAEAVRIVNPFGVDASSKLEDKPGKKDFKKVREFIKNAKSMRI